jgi:hypothetical protein
MTNIQVSGPTPGSYWLVEGRILAGEYPGATTPERARQRLQSIIDAGIGTFVDLTQERDGLEPYADVVAEVAAARRLDLRYRPFAVRDMGVPTRAVMADVLSTLRTELEEGRAVYVHCWGGIGRTGTVAGCWLVEEGHSAAEALDRIAALRAGLPAAYIRSPETDAQCAFIHAWGSR